MEKATARFTDSAGILLARSLTSVDPKVFNRLYPENSFLNAGFDIDNTGGYANSIQKRRLGSQGDFVDASDLGTSKGLISLNGDEDAIKVYAKYAHIKYTQTEIEQAKIEQYNIVEKLFGAGNARYQMKVDEIIATGNTGGEGLLNYSGFTSTAASVTAATATGEELYEEIADLITDQWNGVNNTNEYKANRCMLPLDVYNIASTKTYLPNAGTQKVLSALQEAFPSVTFGFSWRAKDVGGSSVTAVYSTFREGMNVRIPIPLTIGKTVDDGSFGYKADMMFRIAGLDVAENSAGRLLTGL